MRKLYLFVKMCVHEISPVKIILLWVWGLTLLATNVMGAEPYSFPVAVDGYVNLQGRGASGPSWSVELTVQMYAEGNDFPEATFNVQTNNTGAFSIEDTGLEPGNYVISVKNAHTLLVAIAATLNEGSNELTFGSLPEGDANNDNQVTIIDFSILSTSFGLASGNAGFDARADFNEDDAITIQDFSLLSTNFGEAGYVVTSNSYNELLAAQGGRISNFERPVALYGTYIDKPLSDLKTGAASFELQYEKTDLNRLQMKVLISSGDQPIDAASIQIKYDQQHLEIASIQQPGKLPLTLALHADGGTIEYAAGTLENLPRGETEFLLIEFSVKQGKSTGGIEVVTGKSAITYAGKDILDQVLNHKWDGSVVDIYPNPGDGLYHVGIYDSDEEVSYRITDLNGRLLIQKSSSGYITLDLRHLPSGVYLLSAESDTGIEVQRIIKK